MVCLLRLALIGILKLKLIVSYTYINLEWCIVEKGELTLQTTLFAHKTQECIPVWCVPSTAMVVSGKGGAVVSAQGRICLGWCLPRRGVCLGVSAQGRGVSARHPPPPWTESQTGVKTLPCRNYVADGNKIIPVEVMYFVLEFPVNLNHPPDAGVLSGEVLSQPQTDQFSGCHRDWK